MARPNVPRSYWSASLNFFSCKLMFDEVTSSYSLRVTSNYLSGTTGVVINKAIKFSRELIS